MKKCSFCKQQKEDDAFSKTKTNLASKCRSCVNEYNKKYQNTKKFKESKARYFKKKTNKCKNWALQQRYGITIDDYNIMLQEQGNSCFICKKEENGRNLSVDHCHATGEVRGLLCRKCNTGLGYFDDNVEYFEQAINYLKNSVALKEQKE